MSREFERIARIRRQLARRDFEVEVGIGDDAAVLRPTDTSQVLSVDAVVEGVHFERSFLSAADLGYRALMTAASDLAAMGASARASLLSIILPRDYDDDSLELYDLSNDIGEKHNLAAQSLEQTQRMAGKLDAWLRQMDARLPVKQ